MAYAVVFLGANWARSGVRYRMPSLGKPREILFPGPHPARSEEIFAFASPWRAARSLPALLGLPRGIARKDGLIAAAEGRAGPGRCDLEAYDPLCPFAPPPG